MRSSGYAKIEHEFYQEEPYAVDALVAVEPPIPSGVHDPCCGEGTIPKRLRRHGIGAVGSDLVRRWDDMLGKGDFRDLVPFWRPKIIISNPPFSQWKDLVDIGFQAGAERICLLLPIQRLEGITAYSWYRQGKLARFWAPSRRIRIWPGSAPPEKRKGGSTTYAWFVFEAAHNATSWQGGWLPLPEELTHG